MTRLTQSDRRQLGRQLLAALLPDRSTELRNLEQAAFREVLRSFYTDKGLRRIPSLPAEWLQEVRYVDAKASGQPYSQRIYGEPTMLPRDVPATHALSAEAQAKVDRWFAVKTEIATAASQMTRRLDRLLASSATLEQLAHRLPEAREILQLGPEETVDELVHDIRSQLAAKGDGA
jgi:hypothetical protein